MASAQLALQVLASLAVVTVSKAARTELVTNLRRRIKRFRTPVCQICNELQSLVVVQFCPMALATSTPERRRKSDKSKKRTASELNGDQSRNQPSLHHSNLEEIMQPTARSRRLVVRVFCKGICPRLRNTCHGSSGSSSCPNKVVARRFVTLILLRAERTFLPAALAHP